MDTVRMTFLRMTTDLAIQCHMLAYVKRRGRARVVRAPDSECSKGVTAKLVVVAKLWPSFLSPV